jgi:hypothetical protein
MDENSISSFFCKPQRSALIGREPAVRRFAWRENCRMMARRAADRGDAAPAPAASARRHPAPGAAFSPAAAPQPETARTS